MKSVKFNVVTEFHNIPDGKYETECLVMEKLEEENWEQYARKLSSSRSKYPFVQVKIGQEIAVPNWYYELHKSDIIDIGLSFDKYQDAEGNRMPFKTSEAVRHGDMSNPENTMYTVNRFTFVADLDNKGVK